MKLHTSPARSLSSTAASWPCVRTSQPGRLPRRPAPQGCSRADPTPGRRAGRAGPFIFRLAPAGCVVLLGHAGGDAAALADRQAMLFRPGADITRALAAGCGPPGTARLRPPGAAGVLKVGRELLAERGGVLGVQVDLIVGAVEREPDGVLGWAAGQVVFEHDAYFLSHRCLPAVNGVCTVPWPESCDREQRHGSAAHPGVPLLAKQVFPTASPARAATLSYWSCWTPTRMEPPIWRIFGMQRRSSRGAQNGHSVASGRWAAVADRRGRGRPTLGSRCAAAVRGCRRRLRSPTRLRGSARGCGRSIPLSPRTPPGSGSLGLRCSGANAGVHDLLRRSES